MLLEQALRVFGKFSRLGAALKNFRDRLPRKFFEKRGPLGTSGHLWGPLGSFGGLWGPLGTSGNLSNFEDTIKPEGLDFLNHLHGSSQPATKGHLRSIRGFHFAEGSVIFRISYS